MLFHYCFGGQEEARVLNTKQGNEDHEIRSRTEGSSSSRRYFSILKFCILFFVLCNPLHICFMHFGCENIVAKMDFLYCSKT